MNILVVDDEYYALSLIKHAIEEVAGNEMIFPCRDVNSALKTAAETQIDVAFLDIHMPEKKEKESLNWRRNRFLKFLESGSRAITLFKFVLK